ncbi:hypothetical protein [Nocardia cyriacigeorgica]|uniref:hypothetical protein n=1 Tax=Nocardia cyriacigeorgica TaxID=135487 RepID=UPI001319E590|nr:hypothetical protein [Nocardia cyriacigeorgica]
MTTPEPNKPPSSSRKVGKVVLESLMWFRTIVNVIDLGRYFAEKGGASSVFKTITELAARVL